MQFDDRLTTVLRQRANGKVVPSIQYRQLLDLLGTLPIGTAGQKLDAAFLRLNELSVSIPALERAEILRDVGVRLRNPRLLAALAANEPVVALAALANAQLSDDEWIDLIPALPVNSRGLLRQFRKFSPRVHALLNQLGVTPLGLPRADIGTAEQKSTQASDNDEIGAIVRKIEDFRRSKQENVNREPSETADAMRKPELCTQAFDFATDAEGRITWSDPGMAPMAVGVNLNAQFWFEGNGFQTALAKHQPISNLIVSFSGSTAMAGRWRVDAKPCFAPENGSFTGFAGRFRRLISKTATTDLAGRRMDEADRMRQILHELRTPVGAIQGFAEVIQQQVFGPTPHAYRALAASIAADAARILAGFEELDRFARLNSGKLESPPGGCDFVEVLQSTVEHLKGFTDLRNSGFTLQIPSNSEPLMVALAKNAAEHLCWRFLGTLASLAGPDEMLALRIKSQDKMMRLLVEFPEAANICEQLQSGTVAIAGQPSALTTGMFGAGFTLRLVAAEAKTLGGSLNWRENTVELVLPGLTNIDPGHSYNSAGSALG